MQLGHTQGHTCFTKDDLHWLQQTVSSLVNTTDHVTNHVRGHMTRPTSHNEVAIETWVQLFQLHHQVNDLYDNFTSWINGGNWTAKEFSQKDPLKTIDFTDESDNNEEKTNAPSQASTANIWNQVLYLKRNLSKFIHKNEYIFSQFVGSLSELDIKSSIFSHRMRDMQQNISRLQYGQDRLDFQWNNLISILENRTDFDDLKRTFHNVVIHKATNQKQDSDNILEKDRNKLLHFKDKTDIYDDKIISKLHTIIEALEKRVTQVNSTLVAVQRTVANIQVDMATMADDLHSRVHMLEDRIGNQKNTGNTQKITRKYIFSSFY